MSTLIAFLYAIDIALYTFWGFRMDATVFFYMQYPSGAVTGIPAGLIIGQALIAIVYSCAAAWMFIRLIVPLCPDSPVKHQMLSMPAFLIVGGLLFLAIRGSVTTSTANVGMAYFSNKQFLNHSAINPVFSLIASIFKQQDFASQFQFFEEDKRENLFRSLLPCAYSDSVCLPEEKVELLRT
jgi:hypothetical protein